MRENSRCLVSRTADSRFQAGCKQNFLSLCMEYRVHYEVAVSTFCCPAGFRPRGRNPRRHPNVPRVKKKYRIVVLLVCENFLHLMKLGALGGPGYFQHVGLAQQPRKLGWQRVAFAELCHDFIPSYKVSMSCNTSIFRFLLITKLFSGTGIVWH